MARTRLVRVPLKGGKSLIVDVNRIPLRLRKLIYETGLKELKACQKWADTQIKREQKAFARWGESLTIRTMAMARAKLILANRKKGS